LCCMSRAVKAGHGSRESLVLQTLWPLSIAGGMSYTETVRDREPTS